MTEKEKMLSGAYYTYIDAELDAERDIAEDLVTDYNRLHPKEEAARATIIRKLFGSTGEKFSIKQPFYCDYGYNIHVGENFFSNFNFTVLDEAEVRIGDNVLIAPNVSIYTVNHATNIEQRNAGIEYAKPVHIENNVWIGGNTVTLQGVTIGANSIIGAGSVVTKSIPANVIAAGNPCRVIKAIPENEL
ncbi:sugar O-acetyltransferase [Flavobacterium supellecticarium]|uniref:Acetyltransferase n=1 Tax=Flavobacterium supellecticarium TaxID=2565924 RepID=A0A4S4A4A1_9FLAO|nr:sugar O-acetyltransferase [Flavobacterium supellecticarium]THF53128.1 sugar O-acetyltransferase [Flavobacterium supellecticarium]